MNNAAHEATDWRQDCGPLGDSKGTIKRPVSSLLLTLDGIEGDAHAGRTQRTDARAPAFRRGTCEYPSAFAGERRGAERYRVSTRHCVHRSGMGRCQHRNRGRITQLPPGTLLRVSSGASIYIAASRYGEQVNQSANPYRRCSKKKCWPVRSDSNSRPCFWNESARYGLVPAACAALMPSAFRLWSAGFAPWASHHSSTDVSQRAEGQEGMLCCETSVRRPNVSEKAGDD